MNTYSAEYYLDYKIWRVQGENVEEPKLYFEKNYKTDTLSYSFFAVPKEWIGMGANPGESYLPYDEVKINFDIGGVDLHVFENNESVDMMRHSYGYQKFYADGCRLLIENFGSREHSGVGTIDMIKKDESKKNGKKLIARFYFSINFVFKRKIFYEILSKDRNFQLRFKCKFRPKDISVRVVQSSGRLPCLKDDMKMNIVKVNGKDKVKLNFEKSDTFDTEPFRIDRNCRLSVTFEDETVSKFYILEREKKNKIRLAQPELGLNMNPTCLYCHQPIVFAQDNKYYRNNGGLGCQVTTNNGKTPVIFESGSRKAKRCMYCSGDLDDRDNAYFSPDFSRLLPFDFLEHKSIKIAMTGSKRAGKTTYISRFFDINGANPISMNMSSVGNALRKFGIDVHSAKIPEVRNFEEADESRKREKYISDMDWVSTQSEYRSRSINMNPSRFPGATDKREESYSEYPFIAEVNKKTYVSFYDIAGEDAETKAQVGKIAGGETIGVFCIINGMADRGAQAAVVEVLNQCRLKNDTPIAVIVTKMDMLEEEFDVNSQCLRTDYFESGKGYSDKLRNHIDISSEEIRSYLIAKELFPNFSKELTNIKYFGVSAFDFYDSIHDEAGKANDAGEVRFECSPKRIELPFIWMLKQFGVIN